MSTTPAAPRPRWSDADLEAFLDGALPDATHAALAADLREDPGLRARLASITRADTLARTVLLAPAPVTAAAPRRRSPAPLLAAAAALALIAALAFLRSAGPTDTARHSESPTTLARADGDDMIRVVLSIPVRARSAPAAHAPPLEPAPVVSDPADLPMNLLASADPAERAVAYRRLGEVLRSAAAAEAALNALSPAEQLEACRLWADDPRLRPVVFPRLRVLADHPDLTDDLAIVLADLRNRPDLRGWLASHDLLATAARTVPRSATSG